MIHALNYQTDKILDWLDNSVDRRFWGDIHSIGLKDNVETFQFIMSSNTKSAEYFTKRNRIIIPDEDGHLREFIISKVHQTNKTKEVYSSASYLELNKEKILDPVVLNGYTVNTFMDYVLDLTGWKRGNTEYAGSRTIVFENHTRGFDALKHGASEFGLELRFRVVKESGRVIARYVDMVTKVGLDSKKEVVLGKDLINVTRREIGSNLITGLIGVGPEQADGSRTVVRVEDTDALQRWGNSGRHLWDVYEPSVSGDITQQELINLTKAELDKRINTIVEYEANAASMEHIFGYEHEKVRIGDTIRVKDKSWNPPLYLDARVIWIDRSISDKSNKIFTLGDFIEYKEEDIMKTFNLLKSMVAKKASSGDIEAVREYIDQQDASLFDDSTYYADQVSATAEQSAKDYTDQLRTSTNSDIEALQTQVNTLDTYVEGSFKDGVVSEAESKAIKQHLNSLSAEKNDLDGRYQVVYYNPHLMDPEKLDLKNKKDAFNTAYTNLVNSINSAISDGKATSTEITDVNNKFTSYNTAIKDVATSFDNAINKIAQVKSNNAESNAKTYADNLKKAVDSDITGVRTDLDALDTYVDGAFEDSVISQAEAKSIEKYINTLNSEKSDVDTRYNEVYNNSNISGTSVKDNLYSAKLAYNTSHSNLISAINTAISDGKTTTAEKNNVDVKFADYKSKISTLSQRFEEAINAIAQGKVDNLKSVALVDRGDVPSGDWNAIKTMGIYRVNNVSQSTPNYPGGPYNYGSLKVEVSSTTIKQTYTPHRLEDTVGEWTRMTHNGTDAQWSTWKKLETATSAQSRADAAKSAAISAAASDADDKVDILKSYYSYVDSWKTTGTTDIDGGKITTRSILANRIAIGDFTNINKNDPDSNLYNSNTTSIGGYSYFQIGTGAYSKLLLAESNIMEFKVGDEYYLRFQGYKTCNGVNLIVRYQYTDGTWNNASSTVVPFTGTNGTVEANLKITYLPATNKTIRYVEWFFEKDGTNGSGYFYARNIEIRKRYQGELIVDGAITADKLSVNKISSLTSNLGDMTGGSLVITNGSRKLEVKDGMIVSRRTDITQQPSAHLDFGRLYFTWQGTEKGSLEYDGSGNALILDSAGTVEVEAPNGMYVNGSLNSTGSVNFGGTDLKLGTGDTSRGDTGTSRALVKGVGGKLIVNYGNDFYGGVEIAGNVYMYNQTFMKRNYDAHIIQSSTNNIPTYTVYRDAAGANVGYVGRANSTFYNDIYVGSDNGSVRLNPGNSVVYFGGTAKVDYSGGTPRWSKDSSNYILHDTTQIRFYMGGSAKHVFVNDGTKSGGTVEVDGKNLGMSPIDSPQVLLEYVEFSVPLSDVGTKVFLDETYLKTVDNWAAFPNRGEISEVGIDYVVMVGSGLCDIRFIGERTGYSGMFYSDVDQFDLEESNNELLDAKTA